MTTQPPPSAEPFEPVLSDLDLVNIQNSAGLNTYLNLFGLLKLGRAIEREAVLAFIERQGRPIGWWNGQHYDTAQTTAPSINWLGEDTYHDVPIYAGINPCNFREPEVQADRLAQLEREKGELVEALKGLIGDPEDWFNGWRGASEDPDIFSCEYCRQEHPNCDLIPHKDSCPVPAARKLIAAQEGSSHGG